MTDTNIDYQATATLAQALLEARGEALSALNRVYTWVDHPSFDTKTDIEVAFTRAAAQAQFVNRLFAGALTLPELGFDWGAWFTVREAVQAQRGSDRNSVRQALWAFSKTKTDLKTFRDQIGA